MKTKPMLTLMLATVFGFGPAIDTVSAQPDKPEKKSQRDERPDRKRRARRGRDRARYKTPADRMKMLESKLELDENQRAEIEEILRVGYENDQRMRQEMRPTEEELEEMRALREQIRDARDSGDSEAMEAARAAQRAFTERRKDRMDEFRKRTRADSERMGDEIRSHLREDQIKAFDSAWAEIIENSGPRGPRDRDARGVDARRMRRIVDGLPGLAPTQKKQIDELFSEYREKQRKAGREKRDREREGDGEKEADGDSKRESKRGRNGRRPKGDIDGLAEAVMKVLDEEQAAQFRAELDKARAKSNRRAGDKRPGKGGRKRRPTPPTDRDE